MTDNKIIKLMKRADSPLFQRLLTFQRAEAVEEFQQLWEVQKQKVSRTISRRQKVKSNLSMQQDRQLKHNRDVLAELESKMKSHAKKKSQLQLERIKGYQNMDMQWKDKVKKIAQKQRKQSLKSFEKVKELNRAVVEFMEKKNSARSSKSYNFRPDNQKGRSLRIQLPQQQRIEVEKCSNFLTEVKVSIPRHKRQAFDSKSEMNPAAKSRAANTAAISRKHSPRLFKHRTQQVVNPYVLKSRRESQRKQGQLIEHAMEKVQKIMKARQRISQRFKDISKNVKQYRELKHSLLKKQESKSVYNTHSRSSRLEQVHNPKNIKFARSVTISAQQNSQQKLRKEQQEAERFRLRTQVYGDERLKQHRGRFHRMVRDAVNLYRLQTLRQKQ